MNVTVQGSIWTEDALADTVGQRLSDIWMQRGGKMSLGYRDN